VVKIFDGRLEFQNFFPSLLAVAVAVPGMGLALLAPTRSHTQLACR